MFWYFTWDIWILEYSDIWQGARCWRQCWRQPHCIPHPQDHSGDIFSLSRYFDNLPSNFTLKTIQVTFLIFHPQDICKSYPQDILIFHLHISPLKPPKFTLFFFIKRMFILELCQDFVALQINRWFWQKLERWNDILRLERYPSASLPDLTKEVSDSDQIIGHDQREVPFFKLIWITLRWKKM